jgi:hypothetical protein
MSNAWKRKWTNEGEGDNVGKESSYARVKGELKSCEHELALVRKFWEETHSNSVFLKAQCEQLQMELLKTQETQFQWGEIIKAQREAILQHEEQLQEIKLKHEEELMELQLNHDDLVNERSFDHMKWKRKIGFCNLSKEQLQETYDALVANFAFCIQSNEQLQETYDALVANLAASERTLKQQKRTKRNGTRRAVCRAFGWSRKTADPALLRAACGFWEGTITEGHAEDRTSVKTRQEIWYELTCQGFQGKIVNKMDKAFKATSKFDVIKLARKSDVESRFNATSLGAVAQCAPGRRKYERGILCSDATLRRTQKLVYKLASSLGFSSFPTQDSGDVWCWGDESGHFVTGVNRYVYELYVKARSPLVTQKKPWIVALTGDLARVSTRGKAITVCGPKEVDPRLPCQHGTGKTCNQSRNLYTPAVAGYVDEAHLMTYFDCMVECFRDIEKRGYCVVDNVRHEVYIEVIVVADMSYLHKFLRRGGGSHSCTNFCFLCSISSKFRHEGYPGGCLNCRFKNIVYNPTTGTQQCHHHDVCDKNFLEWESLRQAYLEANVKPRIPPTNRPYYECFESLKEQCLLRCKTVGETTKVTKIKTIATLEKWLGAEGRTREGCDLSCNIHTGIRICPLSLVREDLQLRGIAHMDMTNDNQRHALELLLREEEEYLKMHMYVRDNRFKELHNDTGLRGELHKVILDVLHCPMRTNEKVLTLLYEEVLNGAHKAETTQTLQLLTDHLRRVGDLSASWGHKFEKKNTKILQKFKMPHDQSRRLFDIHCLAGLREAVNIAVPALEETKRKEWKTFLHHYVHMNDLLSSSDEYTAEDITVLEEHIEEVYSLLISSIGGKEHGITNYFHYLGSGHVIWMVKRYGNLFRFCNEGVESLNSVVSKRYNMFNNKGGYKSTKGYKVENDDGGALKCFPFEVLGSWLARLSMWHLGLADVMFSEVSTKYIVWDPGRFTYIGSAAYYSDDARDSDWEQPSDAAASVSSDSDDDGHRLDNIIHLEYESDDMSWCRTAATLHTWDHTEACQSKKSRRRKFQQRPLVHRHDIVPSN